MSHAVPRLIISVSLVVTLLGGCKDAATQAETDKCPNQKSVSGEGILKTKNDEFLITTTDYVARTACPTRFQVWFHYVDPQKNIEANGPPTIGLLSNFQFNRDNGAKGVCVPTAPKYEHDALLGPTWVIDFTYHIESSAVSFYEFDTRFLFDKPILGDVAISATIGYSSVK